MSIFTNAELQTPKTEIMVAENIGDCYEQIEALRRENGKAVSFIPHASLFAAADRGRIIIAQRSQVLDGYLLWGHRPGQEDAHIHQIVVDKVERRQRVGSHLVYALAQMLRHAYPRQNVDPPTAITLRCREDLPANAFWQWCGFHERERETNRQTTSGLDIRRYRLEI